MTTLMDFNDKSVDEPEKFYAMHKNLKPEEYKAKIIETYGPAGRDKKMESLVNAVVLLYAVRK
ncbi:MAG: hypothetical protein FWD37_04030 [Methanomassiliicoccaceae archaeon]|nr:hypothetical protein [Methanomassiliicoccaceae archaeon]